MNTECPRASKEPVLSEALIARAEAAEQQVTALREGRKHQDDEK